MVTIPADVAALPAAVLTPLHAVNSVAALVAFALLALALAAIYEREADAAGWLGVIGVGAAMVGTVFMAGDWWYEAFAVPRLGEVAPEQIDTFVGGRLLIGGLSSFALFAVGWLLFGIASLRAGVFPAAASIGIAVGGLMSGVAISGAYLVGGVILGLAIMRLGVWMARTPIAPGTLPTPSAT
jgi:hypothetical protein